MNSHRRYWLAIYPDIRKPIGGAKQMHRFAEALMRCGRQATLIQEQADFHPGWFKSNVNTISLADLQRRSDLDPRRDVVVLPETFLGPAPLRRRPAEAAVQSTGLTVSFREGDGFQNS